MNKDLLKLYRMIIELAEVATDKGVLISEGKLAEGIKVFVEDEAGELVAAADGDYVAEDGKVIVVAEGKVAEIREAEAEKNEPESEEPAAEEALDEEPAEEPAEEADEKDAKIAELEARIAELEAENAELKAELDEKKAESEEMKAQLNMSAEKPAEEALKKENKPSGFVFKTRY